MHINSTFRTVDIVVRQDI